MQALQLFFWWLLVQLLGLAALPVAFRSLRWLPDRGYSFTKSLGLLLDTTLNLAAKGVTLGRVPVDASAEEVAERLRGQFNN